MSPGHELSDGVKISEVKKIVEFIESLNRQKLNITLK